MLSKKRNILKGIYRKYKPERTLENLEITSQVLFKTGKAPGVLLKENGVVSFDIMENAKNISKIILKSSSI